MSDMISGPDGKPRCRWCGDDPVLLEYHDSEWGYPVDNDFKLFEKLCLEGFQSGLSWRTILVKRQNFRIAFRDFEFNKIANFTKRDIERLLDDKGIIRHRGKIEAVINNAKCMQELVEREGSLGAFIWRYEPEEKNLPITQTISTSAESVRLSKELKRRGWKFVGPTTVYAFMQSIGLVNDHVENCIVRERAEHARSVFSVPR